MAEEHTVGIVGTGALGSALAAAALDSGITTSVWNRTPGRARALVEAGATLRPTVADLVASTAVVVITVSTYDDVRSVLTEAGQSVRGRTIVNLSSGTPSDAVAVAENVGSRGGRYLDGAAMSGTRLVGDASAKFFYSGDGDAFSRYREVLEAFGTPLFLGTDPAAASAYDTAILGMILGFLTSSYQALALLQRQDIDVEHFPSVVRDYWPFVVGLFDRHTTQIRTNAITADDGTIDVYVDAIRHVIDTGASLGIDTSLAEAISGLLQRTSDNGHGADGLPYLAQTLNAIGAPL
ncbi:NAD(P)-dependent oxidoreductase [Mycobacterium sp.]|uniref:NAD(P)-dependent oxidoreductase n=1 Tax=Mycobacterium sp. TaxID=1785 RepID=UPI002DA7ACCC|nr:NAD(P)-binding domain-containing protein [Mycobacterium sp.]